MRAAVLTVSDGVAAGEREDESGELLAELLAGEGFEVERRLVADERESIADAIVELAEEAALVLTTGGTGFGPRDVTPEATAAVCDCRRSVIARRWMGAKRTTVSVMSKPTKAAIATK